MFGELRSIESIGESQNEVLDLGGKANEFAEMTFTVCSDATRRFRVPTMPFWNAPLGPTRAISTVC